MLRIKLEYDGDLSDIPEENKHGNCFVVALNKFMENPRKYTLVHGVVTGQGPLEGIQYCHAWVEDSFGDVWDGTLPEPFCNGISHEFYYSLGKIKITRKYDAKKVYDMLDKYETYGPWDSVFNKYP